MNPKRKGDVSELEISKRLVESGLDVYLPFGENTKSDLIVESDDGLYRCQIKTGRLKEDGRMLFNVKTTQSNFTETNDKTYDEDEIDVFLVYCPHLEECYYMPVSETPKMRASLRVEAKQEQKGMKWASDYLMSDWVRKI